MPRGKVMRGYKGRNCKVLQRGYSVVDQIERLVKRYPGGYMFWEGLPEKGRKNTQTLRRRIVQCVLEGLYTDGFLTVLVNGSIDNNGRVKDSELYRWVWKEIYGENTQEMYKDWLESKKVGTKEGRVEGEEISEISVGRMV